MKRLFSITDDLTGAADSGSYFTNRGIELTNYTELNPDKIT
ncbi:four-carbon acid sugar kinase family protein [Enterocloster clostridioformis]|nr:four-carbon acid sugar kinase family protein [Enterocloster clostridioformis]MDB2130493.1 four-carbon acid sugar kinase family protein [Enterocloster clostridioformis]MDU1961218.1 four-carbon acid sugar kinase family protein [Enterocloster clostridioformis]